MVYHIKNSPFYINLLTLPLTISLVAKLEAAVFIFDITDTPEMDSISALWAEMSEWDR